MIYVLIGIIAGTLSGIFGIGGGVVIVPAMMLIAKVAPQRATGTSLAALILPVGALGAWQYYKAGAVDLNAALLIAMGMFLGVFLGARVALQLPAKELQRAFAVFLTVVAIRLWVSAK